MKFSYNSNKQKSFNWKKALPIISGVLLVLMIAMMLGLRQWYQFNLRPVSSEYSEQVVVIESGLATADIAELLEDDGLIRNARVFDWHVNNLGTDQHLQAGTYKLSPSYSTQEIAQIILDGRVDTELITIPPGLRLDQIAAVLVDAGYDKREVDTAINGVYNHPVFKDKPAGASLEGYIFPETYQVVSSSTPHSIIEHALDTFYSELTNEIMSGISAKGLNLYEAITLASIVQKEVSDPGVQKQVAQVFLDRLELGMPLGSDVTFIYAAESAGDEPTVDYDSPYNTRIHGGLPPGPIANFNISALEAVANPAEGSYLYFVAGDDGNTYFAETLAEHEVNVAKHCHELCKL